MISKDTMPRTLRVLTFVLGAALTGVCLARADVVETVGGSVIHGRIIASQGGVIKVETDFAGVIEIKQDQIRKIATDDEAFVALADGNIVRGQIQTSGTGLAVATSRGTITTDTAAITHIWRQGDMSPGEKAAEALRRKWAYELALDLNGREGNSSRFFFGLSGRATLQGPDDRLVFSGNYSQASETTTDPDGNEVTNDSQDEGKVGVDYTNNFSPKLSWYARTELGFDKIKDLDMRSSTSAGLGYNFIRKEKQNLEVRAGVNYRYEAYADPAPDFDAAGLDLGLMHSFKFTFGELNNSITYTPAFSDFGNFVITHVSTLDMPFVWREGIRLRVGLKNDYTSEPPAGFEKHDWSYFSSLVFTWK